MKTIYHRYPQPPDGYIWQVKAERIESVCYWYNCINDWLTGDGTILCGKFWGTQKPKKEAN